VNENRIRENVHPIRLEFEFEFEFEFEEDTHSLFLTRSSKLEKGTCGRRLLEEGKVQN
jgi:hypothetical protein